MTVYIKIKPYRDCFYIEWSAKLFGFIPLSKSYSDIVCSEYGSTTLEETVNYALKWIKQTYAKKPYPVNLTIYQP